MRLLFLLFAVAEATPVIFQSPLFVSGAFFSLHIPPHLFARQLLLPLIRSIFRRSHWIDCVLAHKLFTCFQTLRGTYAVSLVVPNIPFIHHRTRRSMIPKKTDPPLSLLLPLSPQLCFLPFCKYVKADLAAPGPLKTFAQKNIPLPEPFYIVPIAP